MRCADKFKARQFIQFDHKVTSAIWNDKSALWDFEIDHNGQTVKDSAHIFINACGFLNSWKWPAIEGLTSFEGKMLHSAAWDTKYDYKDKTVAVIGSGSSALQIVPNMQPHVKKLDAYIRSPTYVSFALAGFSLSHCFRRFLYQWPTNILRQSMLASRSSHTSK